MSKETRELLKTIIANQEIMMKHLKMSPPAGDHAKKIKKGQAKGPAAKKIQTKAK